MRRKPCAVTLSQSLCSNAVGRINPQVLDRLVQCGLKCGGGRTTSLHDEATSSVNLTSRNDTFLHPTPQWPGSRFAAEEWLDEFVSHPCDCLAESIPTGGDVVHSYEHPAGVTRIELGSEC